MEGRLKGRRVCGQAGDALGGDSRLWGVRLGSTAEKGCYVKRALERDIPQVRKSHLGDVRYDAGRLDFELYFKALDLRAAA